MIPSQTEVRQLMNEAYNAFYKKWVNPSTQYDPDLLMQEAKELIQKYNFQLARDIIMGLVESIDQEIVRRRELSE